MSHPPDLASALRAHLAKAFPDRAITALDVDPLGRLTPFAPDFRVLEVEPNAESSLWIYVTCGTSHIQHPDAERMEFVTASSEQSERVAELLTMTAYYHATQTLGLHHLFGLGEPWVEGSSLTAGYISLPYPWGQELERFDHGDEHLKVYWVMPIHEDERALARREGADALEQRFENAEVEYWDLRRRSVVQPAAVKPPAPTPTPTVNGRRVIAGFLALVVVSVVVLVGYWAVLTREASTRAERLASIEARDAEARARWSNVPADLDVFPSEVDLIACTSGVGLSTLPWRGTYGGIEGAPAVTISDARITIHDATSGFAGALCLTRPLPSGPRRFRALHVAAATQGMSVVFLEIATGRDGLVLTIAPVDAPLDDTRVGPLATR